MKIVFLTTLVILLPMINAWENDELEIFDLVIYLNFLPFHYNL